MACFSGGGSRGGRRTCSGGMLARGGGKLTRRCGVLVSSGGRRPRRGRR
jgi:hypothetical protein